MGCLTQADWLREGTHAEVGRFGAERGCGSTRRTRTGTRDQIRVARDARG